MHWPAIAGLACLLTACATTPPRPDSAISVAGKWTIIAVDGEPTDGGPRFSFDLKPTYGSAQFGCNTGSGTYAVGNGWFVAGDSWIITAASCPDKEDWLQFEREGFRILSKPLTITQRASGIRLRNGLGTIDLVRTPPLRVADIAGRWNVVSINGVGTPGGESFRITFSPREFRAMFGCNRFYGIYAIEQDGIRLSPNSSTEMSCELTGPNALDVPVIQLEAWAYAILRSSPELMRRSERGLDVVSPRGTIALVRPR